MKRLLFVFAFIIFSISVYALGLKKNYYSIDSEDGTFIKVSGKNIIYNGEIFENYSLAYDDYGYLELKFNEDTYTLIDGYSDYILINETTLFKELRKTPDGENFFIPDANLNGINISNVSASSVLTDKYHTYGPEGICKAWAKGDIWWCWVKNNLPWVEGKPDDGIGEYIEFDVNKWGEEKKLLILNGYVNPQKKNLFKENNRVKTAELVCDGVDSYIVNFNDDVEFTEIKLSKEYKHIKLIIKEIYNGTKYSDTCITAVVAE